MGCEEAEETRSEGADAEAAVDSVDWVCRKGNDDEEPPWWFTNARLGYDMDAGIEVGIEDTVRAGVDENSAWQMRHMPQAVPLLRLDVDICRMDHGRAQQGKGGGGGLSFCSFMIIPKVEEMRRYCKRTNEKTLTRQRGEV